SDLDLLRKELKMENLQADARILPVLQEAIAAKRRKFTLVTLNEEILSAEPVDSTDRSYGIAFDIGTTTVVGILWNLVTGEMVDVEGATNPQSVFGSDVISRIQHCIEGAREGINNTKVMQEKMVACMNEMIAAFCKRNGIENTEIYDVTTVGNTTMSHLFLGINPASLAKVPFAPVFSGGVYYRCSDLGLHVNPHAKGYVLPNIAGHVGSDITAVMLATDLFNVPGKTIAIDIGTNGEILVAKDGEVKTCSTAAGPAFEGACIQCGMRAAKGAIEKVVIKEDVQVSTIDNADPIGICGSGLIDVTVQLLNAGLMESNGNLLTREEAEAKGLPESLSSRLYGEGVEKGFLLVKNEKGDDIVITQKDMREVQLAKGAILGGILTLMKKLDFTVDEIDQVYIAGAFGNYIDKTNAITMGLLPAVSPEKVISIGNGAGVGASMALLSVDKRKDAEEKVKIIEHVELSQDMDFQEYYIQSMLF
ncbi:MAG: ASKHA domain-containing protein, partial [Eubacteriales bacterium]|nr:ASKHA domain-containing protein [Eubacteriales bacterium]